MEPVVFTPGLHITDYGGVVVAQLVLAPWLAAEGFLEGQLDLACQFGLNRFSLPGNRHQVSLPPLSRFKFGVRYNDRLSSIEHGHTWHELFALMGVVSL